MVDVDVRGLTEDEVVELLFDQPAALDLAARLRLGIGGDTILDRHEGDAPMVVDAETG